MSSKLKFLAEKYKEFDFNITCITNIPNQYNTNSSSYFKVPSHQWKNLFYSNQSLSDIEKLDWDNSVGLGTVTYNNNLIVIDIDGCCDTIFLKQILKSLGLPTDYHWVVESGSKNGFHIFYYGEKLAECNNGNVVSKFPPKEEYEKYVDKIEFLWRTHLVLPPSAHGSGNRYSFVNIGFPTYSPFKIDKDTIYNFIEAFLDVKEVEARGEYGGTYTLFAPKREINYEIVEKEDITKYLLDDVYLIIDIETSGLPIKTNQETKYPEIVQISWILTNTKGTIIKKNSLIVDTPFLTTNNKSDLINIDFEIAKKVCFPIDYILEKLLEDIKICDFVVAHNIEFDLDILGYYFTKKYGANPFEKKTHICTMKSTVNFCQIPNNYGYKYPKLSELYSKLFSHNVKNYHNAEIDVFLTLKCFKKLKKIGVL